MYFLRRVVLLVPLLLLISFLSFVLVRVAPGGPFDRERKPASPEIERRLQEKYHLDEPTWKQYRRFLADLAHGDFGVSLRTGVTRSMISLPRRCRCPPVWACSRSHSLWGWVSRFGYFSAVRRGHLVDYAGSLVAVLMICIPGFVVAPALIALVGIHWRLFPVALWSSPMHTVLPVIALGLYFSGRIARLMREGCSTQCRPICHCRARQRPERNRRVPQARAAAGHPAGRILLRSPPGGSPDRLVCD